MGDGAASAEQGIDTQEQAWDAFEERLAAYLATMRHVDDHLIIETPDSGGGLTAPYAQVGLVRPETLRAEVSGNAVLEEVHHLDSTGERALACMGWEAPDPEQGFPNHATEVDVHDADELARMIRLALGEQFAVADPGLLSHRAWGPAAGGAEALGLTATDDLPADRAGGLGGRSTRAPFPQSRDDLVTWVGATLAELTGEEVERDVDDDFVLDDEHRVYVRVRADEPTIEVFARVVHEVRSRKRTAVELALLNRDVRFAKLYLSDRSVFMSLSLPALPYAEEHLVRVVPLFQKALVDLRGDLALRTEGRVG